MGVYPLEYEKKKMEKKENLMSSKDCKCYFFRLTLFAD